MYKNAFISETIFPAAIFLLVLGAITNCGSKIVGSIEPRKNTNERVADNSPSPNKMPLRNSDDSETAPTDSSKIPTVTYCDLIKNAAAYDNKIVRVRAIHFSGFEQIYIYDDRCEIGQPPTAPEKVPAETWAEWDKSFVSTGNSEESKLNQRLNGFGRKDVSVIGRFHSTNTENDPNAPSFFGHMGCCRFQFSIMRLEKLVLPRADLDSRVKFERNQPIEIGDLTVEFTGGKNAVVSPIKFDTVSYFFTLKKGAIEKQVSWTRESGDKSLWFEIGGENYYMELEDSKEFGKLPPNEFVIRRTKP